MGIGHLYPNSPEKLGWALGALNLSLRIRYKDTTDSVTKPDVWGGDEL